MTRSGWMVGAVAAAFLSGAAAVPSRTDACPGHMMHGQGQGGQEQYDADEHAGHYLKHLLKHAKEIGLTPEQIGKLKVMQLDFKRTDVRLEADIEVAELELQALLEDDQADFSAIQAKVDQLKKTEGTHLIAAVKSTRNAMALLTPDQRLKERSHREHMEHEGQGQHRGEMGMGGMMGGMGGMGHGGVSGGQGASGHGGVQDGGTQQHQH